MIRNEGVTSLWRGACPTIIRAMALNLGMLGPYDQCKEIFTKIRGPGKLTDFMSSAIAGFFAAFLSLPFDNVKTKFQKMVPAADGKMPYSGLVDCATKTIAKEGVAGLWAGFFPTYYFRIAPHAMMTLLIAQTLRNKFL